MTQSLPATQTIERLLARSACYHALSMLLRHPDAQTAQWLKRGEHHRLTEVVAWLTGDGGGHEVREASARVAARLASVSVEEWTRQHERVFGHSVQGAAPAYELEYGEEHSHRQPQELGDIAAFYQAFGLRASAEAHERVDHIVAECEFLQYLLYKQACALDEGQEEHAEVCAAAARQFLADHLGRWGPAFALRLARAAGEGLLGAAAELTMAWLTWDCAATDVAAGPRDLPLRLPQEQEEVARAACDSCQQGSANGPTTCAVPPKAGQVADTNEVT